MERWKGCTHDSYTIIYLKQINKVIWRSSRYREILISMIKSDWHNRFYSLKALLSVVPSEFILVAFKLVASWTTYIYIYIEETCGGSESGSVVKAMLRSSPSRRDAARHRHRHQAVCLRTSRALLGRFLVYITVYDLWRGLCVGPTR